MNHKEKFVIVGILLVISVLVAADIISDAKEGAILWHILAEGIIGVVAMSGVFYLLRDTTILRHRLQREMDSFSDFKRKTDAWRIESKKYIDGLSVAIDQQLIQWNLTTAEKEVAFLLLKGLSLKEVAEARGTTEKTARVQSMAIYSKAGISGRSELSAFFLEDLLVPATHDNRDNQKQLIN